MWHWLKGFFITSLVFLYFWGMASVHGLLPGLHLAAITISFFVLATPLLSYIYIMGFLPGAFSGPVSIFRIFFLWISLLLMNVFSIVLYPHLFSKTIPARAVFSILTDWKARSIALSISGGFLVYHWLVSKFQTRILRVWFHTMGLGLSLLGFYLIFVYYKANLVIFAANMSSSNL